MSRRGLLGVISAVFLAASLGLWPVNTVWADATISVDGNGTGRTFQGVGGVSAGAAARLAADYPAAQQSQILDYLFRCDSTFCGAALQRLKVEIGGDENSTWGSEASIRRSGESAPGSTSDSIQCRRGYELALLKAAASRNSSIKLDSLEWGAPGWIGTNQSPNSPNFWSQDNANYVNDFMDCAAEPQNQVNGSALSFSTVGLWNETTWSSDLGCGGDGVNYIKSDLYPTLQSRHSTTAIVAADSPSCAVASGLPDPYGWAIASNINSDSTLAADVSYLGAHYQQGCGTDTTCQTALSTAQGLLSTHGQYLWSSENTDDPTTAAGTAQILNRDYLNSKQSATLLCCLIDAWFPSIYHIVGLIKADSPWGNASYTVLPQLWIVAHTTQFTRVGWQYLDAAETCLGVSDCTSSSATGSVVTLKSTGTCPSSCPDFTSVVETTGATTTQNLTFNLSNVKSLACGCVHVWKSDLTGGTYLIQQSDITVSSGSFTLSASPNAVYTITTTSWGLKGSYTQNGQSAFPFPWSDNYQTAGTVAKVNTLDNYYNNFTGNIGMVYQTGAGSLTITELGRYFVTGNTQSHTLGVYVDSTHSLLSPTCSVNTSTAAIYNGFQYCGLSSPITLSANTKYDIVSSETTNGDNWYYYPNTTVSVSYGSVPQAVYQDSGGSWGYSGGSGNAYGPVNFTTIGGLPHYLSDQHGAFEIQPCDGSQSGNCLEQVVTSAPICWGCGGAPQVSVNGLDSYYNNFSGNIGMVYQTGVGGLTITQLGRYFVTGNSQSHTMAVFLDSNHTQVGSSCSVNTSSATVINGFQYCAPGSPIGLAANTKYDIVSSETNGGDNWYYYPNTTVSVGYGSVPQGVYQYSGGSWGYSGGSGNSYGPVNFVASSYAGEADPTTILGRRGPTDAPSATPASGGSLATGTYILRYTYVTSSGETEPSPTNDQTNDPIVLDSTHKQISVSAVTPLPAYATAVKWYFDTGSPTTGFTVQNNGSAFTLNTHGNGTAPPKGNYTIESQVLWEPNQSGTASLLGRIQDGAFGGGSAYRFSVTDSGAWSLQVLSGGSVASTLASGTVSAPGTGSWHTLEMNFNGTTIKVYFDDTSTPLSGGTVTDSTYLYGGVGFSTGWNKVQFRQSCWKTTVGPC